MNERINGLWEQCKTPNWTYDNQTYDHEKFAELIVRECGVALSPMLRDMISRGQAVDMIKQHFGVEP